MNNLHLTSMINWPFVTLWRLLTTPVKRAKQIVSQPSKAFLEVDMLKGLSVLMVIAFHMLFAVFVVFKKQPEALNQFIESIPNALTLILAFDKAVDIFFILSSFLLTYALLKIHHKTQTIHFRQFYLHRFFRLYPLFLLALLLYGLTDIDKLLKDGWYSLLFIENIYSKGIIPVQWSLSIEVQFYLLLPFLIWLLLKAKHPLLWLGLLIFGSIVLRFSYAFEQAVIYQMPWHELFLSKHIKTYMDTMYYLIQTRLTPLLLGILWAWLIWFYPQKILQTRSLTKWLVWLFGLSMIYLSLLFPVYAQSSVYYQVFSNEVNLAAVTLHRILFSSAIVGLLIFSFYQKTSHQLKPSFAVKIKQRFMQLKLWRLLSEVAYPMYFFHFPFIAIAWVLVLGTTEIHDIGQISLWMLPLVFLLSVAMTLYFSLWMNQLIEARFIEIGKRIETKWFGGHNAPAKNTNKTES